MYHGLVGIGLIVSFLLMPDIPPKPMFIEPQNISRVVNLGKRSGLGRWQEVMEKDRDVARSLFRAAWSQFPLAARTRAETFGDMFRFFDGPCLSEMSAWARVLRQSFGAVAMVNCSYELDHAGDTFSLSGFLGLLWRKIFGCTAAVVQIEGGETVHLRNLDWPIPSMAVATRIFKFTGGKHDFSIIGLPGQVGALSGIVPGNYSAAINWAPPQLMPSFDHGPSFLLRETLQECETYEKAVKKLETASLSTSVFYTVCGAHTGCAIERTPDKHVTRPIENGAVVQTNHHVAAAFESNNEMLQKLQNDFLVNNTRQRLKDATQGILNKAIGKSFNKENLYSALNDGEVTNYQTIQRMILRPSTGDIHLQVAN